MEPANECVVGQIAMFLGENGGCTDENKDFIESIIESLEDGIEFDEKNLEFYSEKPLDEFDDKCEGIIALWQRSIDSGNEVFGVLTMDGAILITQEGSPDTVGIGGLYEFNGITYYQYPISHGAPSRKYIGQVQTSTRYFIPIKTTIHTHSPCQNEGSDDGLTTNIIEEDQSFAAQFSNISHYAIGCGAIGQFSGNSNYIFNIEFGELEELCENIN